MVIRQKWMVNGWLFSKNGWLMVIPKKWMVNGWLFPKNGWLMDGYSPKMDG